MARLFGKTTPTLQAAASSDGAQIDDFLDRRVGTMVCSLKTGVGLVLGIGLMTAVGEAAAQPFVKEEVQESNLDTLCGERVGIVRSSGSIRAWALSLHRS